MRLHACINVADVLQDKEGELIKATGLRAGVAHQKWVSPANLTSLLQEVRRAKSSGQSLRLVGGNTGPGVYKDWPVDVDVLIGTTGVPELTNITSRQVHATRRLVRSLCLCCLNCETCLCCFGKSSCTSASRVLCSQDKPACWCSMVLLPARMCFGIVSRPRRGFVCECQSMYSTQVEHVSGFSWLVNTDIWVTCTAQKSNNHVNVALGSSHVSKSCVCQSYAPCQWDTNTYAVAGLVACHRVL